MKTPCQDGGQSLLPYPFLYFIYLGTSVEDVEPLEDSVLDVVRIKQDLASGVEAHKVREVFVLEQCLCW